MEERVQQAIAERLQDEKLSCVAAHDIAGALGLEPLAVGQATDRAGRRIFRCQLGLFGYGLKSEGKHKIVQAMDSVPEGLSARLQAAAGPEGITCLDLWQIADALGYGRLEASGAVEALGLRVSRCQLGCFPRP